MTDYERTARRSDGGQRQDRGIAYDSEERQREGDSIDRRRPALLHYKEKNRGPIHKKNKCFEKCFEMEFDLETYPNYSIYLFHNTFFGPCES